MKLSGGTHRGSASPVLVLFTRYPVPGLTKTRLIPALGPDHAARTHREMTEHTMNRLWRVIHERHLDFEIRFTGASKSEMRRWLGHNARLEPQGDGNLGSRLARAAENAFARGVQSIVMVGADCPALDSTHVDLAFAELQTHPVVFGPATDGGYYLVGLSRPLPEIFQNIAWGTKRVLADSLACALRAGIEPRLLPELPDVDEPADLKHWEQARQEGGTLSVVIPTLNEANHLAKTLTAVAAGQPDEILVVDGGSTDGTLAVAGEFPAKIISSAPGRARQMNNGAAAARGASLLFVHADTHLPAGYREGIIAALRLPGILGGAFRFRIREPFHGRSLVERCVNLRSRLCQLPFGDQGLFVRRPAFEHLGGFPEMPLMEDYEFVRRLRRLGRVVTLAEEAQTSGRRWLQLGVIKTTLMNRLTIIGYRLGVAPSRLAKFYYPRR